jgi:hypothetical protein
MGRTPRATTTLDHSKGSPCWRAGAPPLLSSRVLEHRGSLLLTRLSGVRVGRRAIRGSGVHHIRSFARRAPHGDGFGSAWRPAEGFARSMLAAPPARELAQNPSPCGAHLRRMLDGCSPGSRSGAWPAAHAGQLESRIAVRRVACGECWTVRVQDRGQASGLRRMLDSSSPGSRSGAWLAANAGQFESRIAVRRVACGECWTVRVQDRGQARGLRRMLDGSSPRSRSGAWPADQASRSSVGCLASRCSASATADPSRSRR